MKPSLFMGLGLMLGAGMLSGCGEIRKQAEERLNQLDSIVADRGAIDSLIREKATKMDSIAKEGQDIIELLH